MSYNYVIRLVRMVIVLALQVLFLNRIHVLGYVTPLLLPFILTPFNRGSGRIELLLWGFFSGLLFDTFCNTAGMAAGSMTLLAMLQPVILELFASHDAADDFTPTFKTMGVGKFVTYCLVCSFIVHTMFYALDAFTTSNWQLTLSAIAIGTLSGAVYCLIAELLIKTKN